MSSRRMLEVVNAIHHSLSEEVNQHKPFGGKQVILVGEFLQLRPVPDDLDEGMFMFYLPLFGSAITHRFELTEIMRQFDKDFLSALQDVRVLPGHAIPHIARASYYSLGVVGRGA